MSSYKIGLDFGTHQTKICLEDSSDRRNRRYFFHQFKDMDGQLLYTLPSTVMVRSDRTLAYGYVNEREALQACLPPQEEEPLKPKLALWEYLPKPALPELPDLGDLPVEPDYDQIVQSIPKPVMPTEPVFPTKEELHAEEHFSTNDFSDLSKLLEQAKPKRMTNEEKRRIRHEYEMDLRLYYEAKRTYNKKRVRAIKQSVIEYQQELQKYTRRKITYDKINQQRLQMLAIYERRCHEVDQHNILAQQRYENQLVEYDKILQKWKNESTKKHPIVMHYFKQAVFSSGIKWRYEWSPMLVSIWYLTYVFFGLDEKYGTENLMVSMGSSSGKDTWDKNKKVATQVILSVYRLIEEVFHHDKQAFLRCTVDDLIQLTTIVPYSDKAKNENAIYVFPEAFANLNPLALGGHFGTGMNMLVDIGGGTTDISLFTAPNKSEVQIFDFSSVPYGLNAIDGQGTECHTSAVYRTMNDIARRIKEHARSIGVEDVEVQRVLQHRPIVYTGGGSSRKDLCRAYGGFSDVKLLSSSVGQNLLIEDRNRVMKLIHVLSTALGLAMCKEDDSAIKIHTIRVLFSNVEQAYRDRRERHSLDRYEHGVSDW